MGLAYVQGSVVWAGVRIWWRLWGWRSRQGFSVRLYASTLYAVRCTQYAARPVQYVPTVRCCTLCVPFSSVAAAGMCAGSGLALSGSRVRKGLLQHVACL